MSNRVPRRAYKAMLPTVTPILPSQGVWFPRPNSGSAMPSGFGKSAAQPCFSTDRAPNPGMMSTLSAYLRNYYCKRSCLEVFRQLK